MPILNIVFLSLAVSQLLVLAIYIFLYHRQISPWIIIWRLSAYIDLWATWGGVQLYSQLSKSYGLDLLHHGAQSHWERLDVFNLAPVAKTI